jgi:hypothetical protein
MKHVANFVLITSLTLVACKGPTDDSSGKAADKSGSKSASVETAAKKDDGSKAPTAIGGGESADPPTPPKDPLTDGSTLQASCERIKEDGACTEYYNMGFSEDSTKKLCESMKGTWAKGKPCPKDGRVAVCRTDTERDIYWKNGFEISDQATQKKLCTDTIMGTWGEFPKGK